MFKKNIKTRPSRLTLSLSGVLIVLLLGAAFSFKSIFLPETQEKPIEVLGEAITPYPSPTPSPSPSASISPKPSLKPSIKPSPKPSASTAPLPAPSASSSPASNSSSTSTAPSPSTSANLSQSPTPTPTPSQSISTVNVEVQGSNFTVEISGSMDVCDVLKKAKDQGKISSLTLDDSYKSSMNSLYVKEMNGLSNNWTFKVNGNSPLGCSLYQVQPNDQIVWKFG